MKKDDRTGLESQEEEQSKFMLQAICNLVIFCGALD